MKKPRVYIAVPIPKEAEDYIAQFCDYEKWEKKEEILSARTPPLFWMAR